MNEATMTGVNVHVSKAEELAKRAVENINVIRKLMLYEIQQMENEYYLQPWYIRLFSAPPMDFELERRLARNHGKQETQIAYGILDSLELTATDYIFISSRDIRLLGLALIDHAIRKTNDHSSQTI